MPFNIVSISAMHITFLFERQAKEREQLNKGAFALLHRIRLQYCAVPTSQSYVNCERMLQIEYDVCVFFSAVAAAAVLCSARVINRH